LSVFRHLRSKDKLPQNEIVLAWSDIQKMHNPEKCPEASARRGGYLFFHGGFSVIKGRHRENEFQLRLMKFMAAAQHNLSTSSTLPAR